MGIAADDQNRVVAGDRAEHFGERRAIDGDGQQRGLPRIGPQHHQLLGSLGPGQELGRGPLEAAQRVAGDGRPDAALVGAVAGPLDDAEFLEIARQCGLRHVHALGMEALPQHLLAGDALTMDDVENDAVPVPFHVYASVCSLAPRSTRE